MAASRTIQTYETLKQELLDGAHAPRSKLPIDQVAERFGVSLGAVREALSRLTSDRLVVAEPQRGFTVAPVSDRGPDRSDDSAHRYRNALPSTVDSSAATSNGKDGSSTPGTSFRARRRSCRARPVR